MVGAVLVVILRRWRKNLHNPPANRKQEPIPEEIYRSLPTNKKQGNQDQVHTANIIKPTQTRIYREKYTFCIVKSLEHLKYLKTGHVPYLSLELTMHDIKSTVPLINQQTKLGQKSGLEFLNNPWGLGTE